MTGKQIDLFDIPAEKVREIFEYPVTEKIDGAVVVLGHHEEARCTFKHHKEYGKVITCTKCGGPLTCGPLAHACKECDPFEFQRCGICRQPRVFCYC